MPAEPLCYVLDSGAIIAESRGDPRVRALLERALKTGGVLVVPAIVITETYRGEARSVSLNWLLKTVDIGEADLELAKDAGRLLALTSGSNAPDAQVVAEAHRRIPCTILTSDQDDIATLVNGWDGIEVLDVGKL